MPGLDLGKSAIIDEDGLEEGVITVEEIEQRLIKKGLEAPPRPSGQPTPLAEVDVNAMSNDELAALFANYVAYQSFLSIEVARAKMAKHLMAGNLKTVTAKLKAAFHAKGIREAEIVEQVRLHPLYLKYDGEAAEARYIFEMTEAYDRSYGKQASALSRCMEVRKIELERLRREGNVGAPSFGKSGKITRPHRRPKGPSVSVRGPGASEEEEDDS